SGHSKWSKVKHFKGAIDAKRGKLFTKLTKEIIVAVRMGGGRTEGNSRLRHAVTTARAASMPKENIERAIKKGTGELQGEIIEECVFEGYGPGGVAVLVEVTTDNRNRTVSDLRNLFKTGGGTLAEAGSVSWMFTQCGQLLFDQQKYPEDKVMEVALETGAQDVVASDGMVEVITSLGDVYKVKESFERVGMHPESAGLGFIPKSSVTVEKTEAEKLLRLLETLEDHDDVQKVHSNFEVDEKILAQLTQ
ncbi:MAG: YebC/PmpR family DNA-binding transcriptional regulator, partial [Deltaproteobacteria bacterium]|nr:YebC/PmpR family DNA-binding transcriptional regulator [Deltaproteobacteria bacterium]